MVDIADMKMEVDSSDVDRAELAVDKLAQAMKDSAKASQLYNRKLAGEYSLAANKIEQATRSVARMRANYAKEEQDKSRMIINAQRGLIQMQEKANLQEDRIARQTFQRTLNLQKAREQEAFAAERASKKKIAAEQAAASKADANFRKEYTRIISLQKAREQEAAAAEKESARQVAAAKRTEKAEDAAMRQQYQRLLAVQKAREQASYAAERAAEREAAAARRQELAEANKRTAWVREEQRMTKMFIAESKRRQREMEIEEAKSRTHGRGIISTLSHIRGTMLSLSGIAAGVGVLALYNSLNKYTELTNLFKVLGFEGEKAGEKLRELQDVARTTRSPVEELTKIYQKTTMASKELGASQEDILRFTKNVGLALAQQGGATISTRGALLQLAQAIGMGVVRAEEFNSMLEGGYPILVTAARGIEETGGSVMKLRQMMLAGELTSKMFFDAILSQSESLEQIFGRTIPTLSQSLTVFRDTFMVSIGEMDHAVGFSQTLAQGIINVSSAFVDFTRFVTANADTVRMLGNTLSELGVILTTVAVLHFGKKFLSAITAAGGGMMFFTRAVNTASAALKAFLPAAVIGTMVNVVLLLREHSEVAKQFDVATKSAAEAQKSLNTALSDFENNRGFETASILKAQSEESIASINAALEAAKAQLEAQGFYTNLFGAELFETEAMAATRAEITRLQEQLVIATGMLGMADAAAKSLAVTMGEAAVSTEGMSDKSIAAAYEINSEMQRQLEILRATLAYGEKSYQVEAIKREHVKQTAEEYARQKDFNDAVTASYVDQQLLLYDLNNTLRLNTQYAELVANAWKEINKSNEAAKEKTAEAQALVTQYEQQAELSRTIARYGEDSAKVEALKRQAASEAAYALIEQHNVSGPLADKLYNAYMAAHDASVALDNGASSADYLSNRLSVATGFAAQLLATLGGVPGAVLNLAGQVDAAIGQLQKQNSTLTYQLEQGYSYAAAGIKVMRDEAIAAGIASGMSADQAAKLGEAYDAQVQKAETLSNQNDALSESLREQAKAADGAGKAAKKAGGAKKGAGKAASDAAKEVEKLNKELDTAAERWKEQLDPTHKYRKEVEELNKLQGRLSSGEMSEAMKRLNAEFADSLPLVGELTDTLVEGLFNGFEGTLDSIKNIFKRWLIEMISMAAKNQIIVSMGASMGGVPGLGGGDALSQALGNIPGLGGGGTGLLGSLVGSFSGGLNGVLGGVASGWSSGGLFGAIGGGVSSAISGITGGLAAGGVAGIASAIGAAVPIIGAVLGVVSIGKKLFGRKLKDTGIEASFDLAEGIIGRTYKFYKGGLLRSDKTKYSDMDAEMEKALGSSFTAMYDTVVGYAETLGLATDKLKNVKASFKFSTKDMSEEDIQARFEEEILKYGDALADAAATVTTENLKKSSQGMLKSLEKTPVFKNIFDALLWAKDKDLSKEQIVKLFQEHMGSIGDLIGKGIKSSKQNVMFGDSETNITTASNSAKEAMSHLGKIIKDTGDATVKSVEQQAQQVNLLDKYRREGESSVQTLERLAVSLSAVNSSMTLLGYTLKEVSVAGGAASSRFVDMFGGVEEMNSAVQFFFENFYTTEEKIKKLTKGMKKSLSDLNITTLPKTMEEYRKLVDRFQGNDKILASLLQLAPAFKALMDLQEQLGTGGLDADAVLDERKSLLEQLWRLQGKTNLLRKAELEKLHPSNRALQKRIWALEDEKRILDERQSIENQYYQLIGNTGMLRKRELKELHYTNRALQKWVWKLTDVKEKIKNAEQALQSSVQARQSEVDALRNTSNAIREMANEALSSVSSITEEERKRAVQQLNDANRTGAVWDESLQEIAEKASQVNSQNFRSAREYLLASAQTAAALNSLADKQELVAQTEEDRLVAILETYGLQEKTLDSLDKSIRRLNILLGSEEWFENRAPDFNINTSDQEDKKNPSPDVELMTDTMWKIQQENRVLLMQVSENTRKLKQISDEWNAIGMPLREA